MPGSVDLFGMTVPPAQPTAVAAEPFCLAVRFPADRLSAHGTDIVRRYRSVSAKKGLDRTDRQSGHFGNLPLRVTCLAIFCDLFHLLCGHVQTPPLQAQKPNPLLMETSKNRKKQAPPNWRAHGQIGMGCWIKYQTIFEYFPETQPTCLPTTMAFQPLAAVAT